MKKAISLILALMMCLSLCACGVSLTAEQKEACKNADGLMERISEIEPGSSYKSKVKSIGGETVYIGTLDIDGKFNAAAAFQDAVMPALEGSFSKCDMFVVLYIKENGKDAYRIIDSGLDPDILD